MLIPLAIAAILRTTDMAPVYDVCREATKMPNSRLAPIFFLTLCTTGPLAFCQLTGTTGIVPPSRGPQPLDSTAVRQQAAQGLDSMSSQLKISYGKKSAE